MITQCGKSARTVSKDIGRTPTFLSASLAQGNGVSVNTLILVANETGYELVLKGRGEEIPLDPTTPSE